MSSTPPRSKRRIPLGLYRVAGDSMRPTYSPGDTLVGLRWFRPCPGQVVVLDRDQPLIKRIIRLSAAGVWVEGDNPSASTDSRHFGPVSRTSLEALILMKL